MLEFCGRKFTCDECPICEGIEHRLRVAREGGYEPQLEYCGCDKVQTEFFISGYCSDAFEADKPQGITIRKFTWEDTRSRKKQSWLG